MLISIEKDGVLYTADLDQPIDISIPLTESIDQVNCFYAPPFQTSPVVAGSFIGSTRQGGALNFLNVKLNPHGNGTHTECVGHIAKEFYTINKTLRKFFNFARLVSVYPVKQENGDRVIQLNQIEDSVKKGEVDSVIIRTLPNSDRKLSMNYSGTNPPFVDVQAIKFLVDMGIKHLLIDLPSIDREEDEGALAGHKAFWKYPESPRLDCTISELIYVPDSIKDGIYLLNLQIAAFEIDVSPSKPILYAVKKK